MGISAGPNIIDDGLVLAMDAADTFLPVNKNLLTYTNDLSNAAWSKVRAQIIPNATIAPDGTNTAFAMNIADATGLVRISQIPVNASVTGGPYTFSVYVKQNTTTAQLFDTGLYTASSAVGSEPSYDILNNFAVAGANGTYVSNRVVTPIGNGWYRVATTATIPNATGWYLFFDIEAGAGTKVNGQGIYLWGPQFEYGTVATEYQPVNVTTRVWPNLINQSNNGALINNPTFNSTNRGSIVFDGVNDYVGIPQVLNTGQNFSVFAWINPGAINVRNAIVGNGYPYTSTKGWLLATATNYGNPLISNSFFISIGSDNAYRTAANNSIIINTWNYIGAVVTNGGQDIKLYSNGIETSYYGGILSATTITYDVNELNIGRRYSTNQEPFIGSIANVKIYNKVLSASEVIQNYNAQKSRFGL